MQEVPLTIQHVLGRMRIAGSDASLVYPEESKVVSFEQVSARIDRLASALRRLGVHEGDRVGTLMWNRPEHFEAFIAVPAMGAVLHTLNQRLFGPQLAYTIAHAGGDRVIIVEDTLVPLLESVIDQIPEVEHFLVVGAETGELSPASRYEDALAAEEPGFDYPAITDERQASALVYTSGTTGNPKGVLYTHRSIVLQAITLCMADTFGIAANDRVLQISPMFHALGWCMPYTAAMAGATVVLPGRDLRAARICKLIEDERITMSGAVPTILTDMLEHADEHHPDFSSMRFFLTGASAVPPALMRGLEERHGLVVTSSWGMTEMGPVGGVARPPGHAKGEDAWRYRHKTARVFPLAEYRIMDEDGRELPWDGKATGELELRAPFAAGAYLAEDDADARFRDGWLRTGDIGSIDPQGYFEITDRLKDVIKSGGEWISSVELENALMAHENVREAAVVAMPHPRWKERPLACVVRRSEAEVSADQLRDFLAGRVASWWLPDAFSFIDAIPRTGTGKYDKKLLRAQLANGELQLSYPHKAGAAAGGAS